jgi:Dolichyl-phosphate-mannose-protein mannosyltransferase
MARIRERVGTIRPPVVLGFILVLALLLRLIFFVGLVSGDPQDDGVYYGNALALANDGPRYLALYRNLPKDFIANPIDQFNVRPMVTYPIAAIFLALGPGEIQASLWGLICSLLSVLVLYRVGAVLHDQSVGLIAAFLCAIYPLEIINGTRILSDVPVGLFSSLALLCFVLGGERSRPMMYFLSGAAAAGAYLANGRGLLLVLALVGSSVLLALFRKVGSLTWLWVCGGFLAVFSIEAAAYSLTTGDPFLSYRIQSSASYFKYLHEPVSSLTLGHLRIDYTNGTPLELFRTVFRLNQGPTNQFGPFFYLFTAATLFSVVRRKNLLLICMAVGLAVFMEFGPLRMAIDWRTLEVTYMMLFKQERFLGILTGPLVVMAAYFLCAIGRASRVAGILLAAALLVSSLSATAQTRDYYRAGLDDLRAAATNVEVTPEKVFFADYWAVLHMKIFSGYTARNLETLSPGDTIEKVKNGCVVLGGSRGVELLAGYVETTLPTFARGILDTGVAPEGWQLMRVVKGYHSPQRTHDLAIYCVP